MKTFKTIDLCISIALFAASIIFALITLDYHFIIGYLVTGAWQVTSMIVHQVKGWFTETGTSRLRYHITVLVTILGSISAFTVAYVLFPLLFIMLFAAPFMALYYIRLCYNELNVKMQRPLALLK